VNKKESLNTKFTGFKEDDDLGPSIKIKFRVISRLT